MLNSVFSKSTIVVGTLITIGILSLLFFNAQAFNYAHALGDCESVLEEIEQIDCIQEKIEEEMQRNGVGAAMNLFTHAYNTFPSFVAIGCHTQAHRVGDYLYYSYFRGNKDIDDLDFPQSTTACGYGMFHGFLEHLIQDNPDPQFVTNVCTNLVDRLGHRMNDIQVICYHGSGHGFTLAHAEKMPKSEWGNAEAFTLEPSSKCDELSKARPSDIEECKEGVYNVLVNWMKLQEYGFTYNKEDPFAICNRPAIAATAKEACYYEMAQKLDGLTDRDARKLADIVNRIDDRYLRLLSFRVGIAGIIQNVILDENGYQDVLSSCMELSIDFHEPCVRSVVNGLYEHGSPGKEYEKALLACEEEPVIENNLRSQCYKAVSDRLPRFYAKNKISSICTEFPKEFRENCIQHVE